MKKLILIFGIAFIGVACNFGKSRQEEKRAANLVKKLTEVCQLTPDQASKMQPILVRFVKTNIDNKDKFASDQDALKKADSLNRLGLMDTLKMILTPDQFTKFQAAKGQFKMSKPSAGQDNSGQE